MMPVFPEWKMIKNSAGHGYMVTRVPTEDERVRYAIKPEDTRPLCLFMTDVDNSATVIEEMDAKLMSAAPVLLAYLQSQAITGGEEDRQTRKELAISLLKELDLFEMPDPKPDLRPPWHMV